MIFVSSELAYATQFGTSCILIIVAWLEVELGRCRYFRSVSVFGIFFGIFKSRYRYRCRYVKISRYRYRYRYFFPDLYSVFYY